MYYTLVFQGRNMVLTNAFCHKTTVYNCICMWAFCTSITRVKNIKWDETHLCQTIAFTTVFTDCWIIGKVQLRSLCEAHIMQDKDCLKRKFRNKLEVAATAMTMKFTLARKYLCLHQNKTFYAVVSMCTNLLVVLNALCKEPGSMLGFHYFYICLYYYCIITSNKGFDLSIFI